MKWIWDDIKLPALKPYKQKQLEQILLEVAKDNDIPIFMIKGSRRFQELVKARSQFVVRARKEIKEATLKEIGEMINKDHSTVINLLKWNEQ